MLINHKTATDRYGTTHHEWATILRKYDRILRSKRLEQRGNDRHLCNYVDSSEFEIALGMFRRGETISNLPAFNEKNANMILNAFGVTSNPPEIVGKKTTHRIERFEN